MNRLFRTTVVETSGVRTIAGGGTNASNAGQALLNLSGVSITGDQTINGYKTFSGTLDLRSEILIPSRRGDRYIQLGSDISDIDDFGTLLFIGSGLSGLSSIYRSRFQTGPDLNGYGIVFGPIRGSGAAARKGYLTASGGIQPTGLESATLVWTDRILSGQWTASSPVRVGDSVSVMTTGNQTISGVKNFASRLTVNATGVVLSGEAVQSNGTVTRMIRLTQAQYDALSPKDPTTFYVIVG